MKHNSGLQKVRFRSAHRLDCAHVATSRMMHSRICEQNLVPKYCPLNQFPSVRVEIPKIPELRKQVVGHAQIAQKFRNPMSINEQSL